MERLVLKVQEAQKVLSNPDAEWTDHSLAIEEVAVAVESVGPGENTKEAMRHVMLISREIGVQITGIRSRLVKDVCDHLLRIVKVVNRDFQEMANALLPQIVQTAKNASGAIRQPGAKLLNKLSELVRFDVELMRKVYMQSPQEKVRLLLLEQLMIVFVYWSDDEVGAYDADILEMLRRGMDDHAASVRKAARDALTRFSARWSERVEELAIIPSSQSRGLLVNEQRDSALSTALLKKYPELANKSNTLSRSRYDFAKQRSAFQKSPRRRLDEDIEIHVATPPSKQRAQRENDTEGVATIRVGSRIESTTAGPGSARREANSLSRRLFQDTEQSGVRDGSALENPSEAFDGSQMHAYRLNARTEVPSAAPLDNTEMVNRQSVAPSRIPLARRESGSSPEDTKIRRPTITRVQAAKNPGGSTWSPTRYGKPEAQAKATGSGGNSPEECKKQSTNIPRPRGFSTKYGGDSAASDPTVRAGQDSGPQASSARDDFFSKPIPSTSAIPTPPPPSTDNVTFRSRRRTFVRQEQEDLQVQTQSPAPPATAVRNQPRYQDVALVPNLPQSPARRGSESADEPQATGYVSYKSPSSENDLRDMLGVQPRTDREWDLQGGDNGQLQHRDESNLRRKGNDQPELGGEEDVQREEHTQPDYENGFGFAGVDGGGNPLDNRDDSNSRNEIADAKVIDTVYSPKTDWHPQPDFRFSRGKVDFGCEDEVKEERPNDLKLDNLPKDALDSLQDVRDQISRLRARTLRGEDGRGLPFKDRRASGMPNEYSALQAPTVGEEPEQQSPVNNGMQMWDQPRSTESNYLERLMHADQYGAGPRESKAAPRVDNSHGRFQQNELPGPRTRLSDPMGPSAHHDVQRHETADFTREYRPVDYHDPRAEVDTTYMPAHRAMTGAPEAFSTQEPAARYDAAGEFAIPKRGAGQDQRRVRHPEKPRSPAQHAPAEAARERFPPTKMGQKLNAVFAGARHNAVNDRAFSKNTVVEADAAKRVQDSKPRERHGGNQFHPVPSFVEEVQASAERGSDEQDAAETTGNMLRPLSKPPVKATEVKFASTELSWTSSIGITFFILLAVLFSATGILQAASKVRDSHEYHLALKLRIDKFEASIAESHETVHKLEENYAIWSEYVRMLAEEDEANALAQLETIQHEVEKWQVDMKADLLEFRRSLSVDSVDAALTPLRANNTQETGQ